MHIQIAPHRPQRENVKQTQTRQRSIWRGAELTMHKTPEPCKQSRGGQHTPEAAIQIRYWEREKWHAIGQPVRRHCTSSYNQDMKTFQSQCIYCIFASSIDKRRRHSKCPRGLWSRRVLEIVFEGGTTESNQSVPIALTLIVSLITLREVSSFPRLVSQTPLLY